MAQHAHSGMIIKQPTIELATIEKSSFPRIRVEFLLNYTRPDTVGLRDFFGTASTSRASTPPALLFDELYSPTQFSISPELNENLWDSFHESREIHLLPIFQPSLQRRLVELTFQLKAAHELHTTRSGAALPVCVLEDMETLFTVDNLLEFTRLYFDNWHCNCPIIHQPSFNLEIISLPLLLAVFLIGATYSFPRDTASMARECLDLAENFAFEHRDFKDIFLFEKVPHLAAKSSIEALQATFLVAVLQNWQNGSLSRRRMRTKRYSEIVSAARLLGLTSATNNLPLISDAHSESFNWNECFEAEANVRFASHSTRKYLATDECFRLMYYIFLVDCQYTIFYRYPPRLMVSEMTGGQPFCEEAFAAPDAATCQRHLLNFQKSLSLSGCIQLLLAEDFESKDISRMENLTTLNLFGIINGKHHDLKDTSFLADFRPAFHSIIYTMKANHFWPLNSHPISRALSRWKVLWERHLERIDPQAFSKIGFMKNAVEFWHLTRIFLKTGMDPNVHENKTLEGVDEDSMAGINSLLERFQGVSIS